MRGGGNAGHEDYYIIAGCFRRHAIEYLRLRHGQAITCYDIHYITAAIIRIAIPITTSLRHAATISTLSFAPRHYVIALHTPIHDIDATPLPMSLRHTLRLRHALAFISAHTTPYAITIYYIAIDSHYTPHTIISAILAGAALRHMAADNGDGYARMILPLLVLPHESAIQTCHI